MIHYKIVKELAVEGVVELYKDAGWWEESVPAREIIPAMIKGSFCVFAAFDGENLVGMGRVISDGVSDGYIEDIIVKKRYRRQGIGSQLLQRLTAFCKEKKLEWTLLIAAPGTCSFYEEAGFEAMEAHTAMRLKND